MNAGNLKEPEHPQDMDKYGNIQKLFIVIG